MVAYNENGNVERLTSDTESYDVVEGSVSRAQYDYAGNTTFESPEHALHTGMVWGASQGERVRLVPVMDGYGNYTPRFELVGLALPGDVRAFLYLETPARTRN